MESCSRAGSVAVQLAEDVEGGDEADEAEAHHEHHRRRDLQAGSVIGVEPKHVARGAGAASDSAGAASAASDSAGAASAASGDAAAAHAGGGRGGAAGSHDSRPRGGRGGCGLRLRGASRHVVGAAKITREKY